MSLALQHGAGDLVVPDLERIGGVSGWQQAAALAVRGPAVVPPVPRGEGPPTGRHPTAHRLEHVDWAAPSLLEPLRSVDGSATPPDRPADGLEWDPAAVARCRVG